MSPLSPGPPFPALRAGARPPDPHHASWPSLSFLPPPLSWGPAPGTFPRQRHGRETSESVFFMPLEFHRRLFSSRMEKPSSLAFLLSLPTRHRRRSDFTSLVTTGGSLSPCSALPPMGTGTAADPRSLPEPQACASFPPVLGPHVFQCYFFDKFSHLRLLWFLSGTAFSENPPFPTSSLLLLHLLFPFVGDSPLSTTRSLFSWSHKELSLSLYAEQSVLVSRMPHPLSMSQSAVGSHLGDRHVLVGDPCAL